MSLYSHLYILTHYGFAVFLTSFRQRFEWTFCSIFSCNTMFEKEKALWTASRTAWKFPIAYPWSGALNVLLGLVTLCHNFTISIGWIHFSWVWVSDDTARRCKSHNRNRWRFENWSSCNESHAEGNVSYICTILLQYL